MCTFSALCREEFLAGLHVPLRVVVVSATPRFWLPPRLPSLCDAPQPWWWWCLSSSTTPGWELMVPPFVLYKTMAIKPMTYWFRFSGAGITRIYFCHGTDTWTFGYMLLCNENWCMGVVISVLSNFLSCCHKWMVICWGEQASQMYVIMPLC